MAESEDLKLQRRPAAEGSEKRGQKSGQQVPERESKEKGQPPVYQSDRILREPQATEALQPVAQIPTASRVKTLQENQQLPDCRFSAKKNINRY
jgi:hypothetical protein